MRAWGMRGPVAPLVAGLALRAVAAASGFGWFAVDDYDLGIAPAGTWLTEPDVPFSSTYRSPLLAQALSGLLRLAAAAGIADPAYRLQWAYAGLGLYSLLAIPAVARLCAARLGPHAARQAAWLMAAFALLPRVATRALIESAAMVPLSWGAVCFDRALRPGGTRGARVLAGLGAGALFGGAALLRFQVGVIFAAAAAVLAVAAWRGRHGRPWSAAWSLLGLAAGGVGACLAQAAIDVALGRAPLSTPRAYVAFNLAHSASYGTSAWHTYLAHFVCFTAPPATLWLARPLWQALRRHWPVTVLLAAFVAAHSLVGHKEDRFMFPVLPLFFVPLGAALAALQAARGWRRAGFFVFWGINVVGLALATTSDAHRNLTVPLLRLARERRPLHLAAVGFGAVPAYYAGTQAEISLPGDLDALAAEIRAGRRPDYLLLRHPPDAAVAARLAALPHVACGPALSCPGDLMDRLLVRFNRHNARRAATALVPCRPRRGDNLAAAP